MKEEIFRKLIHLSSLIYPIIYFLFFTKIEMILIIGIIMIFVIITDLIRVNSKWLNAIFHTMLRDGEKRGGFSGATFFMIGTFLTVVLFSKNIAIASLCILVISDTAAAIFGKMIKSKKILGQKSVAGSFAFLLSSVALTSFLFYSLITNYNALHVIIPCLLTTIAELFAKKINIDDNILIPITFGLTTYFTFLMV